MLLSVKVKRDSQLQHAGCKMKHKNKDKIHYKQVKANGAITDQQTSRTFHCALIKMIAIGTIAKKIKNINRTNLKKRHKLKIDF